ncbi:MAG: response regulator [Candidatus Paceibacterota bacterium]
MRKILIIEDDSFLQGLEASKLEKEGYGIITASSGGEAMKKINEPNIDVILLDLILPDFDGFELLKKIREIKTLKNVPVIVFSNLSEEKDIKKSKELGATDFMVKSNFTLDEMIEHINKILK